MTPDRRAPRPQRLTRLPGGAWLSEEGLFALLESWRKREAERRTAERRGTEQ